MLSCVTNHIKRFFAFSQARQGSLLATVLLFIFVFWTLPAEHTPPQKSGVIALMAGSYKERVPAAAELFHKGYGRLIILADDGERAGWSQQHERNLYKVERAEEELVRLGVSRKCIVKLPFNGNSTRFDALAVKRYVVENNIHSLLIVTSDYHLPRAVWICRKLFRNYPVNISSYPAKSLNTGISNYAVEYTKLAYYRLRWGWCKGER